MSDVENDDDYLSDKFIAQNAATVSTTTSKQSVTYAERRRQTLRASELKNAQNRRKSRRQLEEESLREGLSKSLFEKAAENGKSQNDDSNKAMNMMLKMGYQPGQSLGAAAKEDQAIATNVQSGTETVPSQTRSGHLVEPIRVEMWSGRQGVGKRKRNVSPTAAAKLAKLVQESVEEQMRGSYRERTRAEYEEKRAEGRLAAARRTCITLDEGAGKKFNVYWLDPLDPETFPSDLLQILTSDSSLLLQEQATSAKSTISQEERLRIQMRADALLPSAVDDLEDDDDGGLGAAAAKEIAVDDSSIRMVAEWPERVLQEVRTYISVDARTRLKMVLEYLRSTYRYCFWCGTQYEDIEDLEKNCPGTEEEDHD